MKKLAVLSLLLTSFVLAAEPVVKPEDLPRTKPVEAKDALKTFKVKKGFHLELAAAEPNVMDPICMCWDENGRLFVVEMRDYSERRAEKLSRIRMLEDTDGDGVYDKATIFMDNLPWATAIFPYKGGLLIGATPDIIYAKDTNGDGVADHVEKLFTGFANIQGEKVNVQGLFNNFIWGLDNRIHGCSGEDGGNITQLLYPDRPALNVLKKGFVIDPRDWSMTREAGGGQYGLSFDPFGQMYSCTNSSNIDTLMYDLKYAERNPYYNMPDGYINIAVDGPAAEVYRISPEEPWRVMRTRWRIGGLVGGPVEGGGRSAGYFTSASGITIYKGDAYGPEYVGDAFIAEPAQNLVHHKKIHRDGVELTAERTSDEAKTEFIASKDNWFRPVDFANGPDGCLYVADMYREIIEHPWSLPPSIKKYLDLNSGNDRGRIYRIVKNGFDRPSMPKLGMATTKELVEMLDHPDGWHRETAARLIFERQDKSVLPQLETLLVSASTPVGRVEALHAIEGLGALSELHVISTMSDKDPNVRAHGVKMAEKFINDHGISDALWNKIASLAGDSEAIVRYQVAFTAGEVDRDDKAKVLAEIVKKNLDNQWIQAAVLSGCKDCSGKLFEALADNADAKATPILTELASIVAQAESQSVEKVVAKITPSQSGFEIASGLLRGAERANQLQQLRPQLANLFELAKKSASDANSPVDARAAGCALLAYGQYDDVAPALLVPIEQHHSSKVQLAALAALDHFNDPRVGRDLIKAWPSLEGVRVKSEVLSVLIKRPDRSMALLNAMQDKTITQNDLNAQQVHLLLHSSDAAVKQLASKAIVAPSAKRETVIESFKPAINLAGDIERGKKIYESRCISCHRANGEGNGVGPDLVTVGNWGKSEKLLTAILDPSREVAPNYIAFTIETKDGESITGVVASDNAQTITLRQAFGKETIIQRSNILHMISNGKSLMPDGLEVGLTQQNVADLLEFVSNVKSGK